MGARRGTLWVMGSGAEQGAWGNNDAMGSKYSLTGVRVRVRVRAAGVGLPLRRVLDGRVQLQQSSSQGGGDRASATRADRVARPLLSRAAAQRAASGGPRAPARSPPPARPLGPACHHERAPHWRVQPPGRARRRPPNVWMPRVRAHAVAAAAARWSAWRPLPRRGDAPNFGNKGYATDGRQPARTDRKSLAPRPAEAHPFTTFCPEPPDDPRPPSLSSCESRRVPGARQRRRGAVLARGPRGPLIARGAGVRLFLASPRRPKIGRPSMATQRPASPIRREPAAAAAACGPGASQTWAHAPTGRRAWWRGPRRCCPLAQPPSPGAGAHSRS